MDANRRRTATRARRLGVAFSTAAGTTGLAAVIGMTAAPAAHADDTAGNILSQAEANISQAGDTLYAIPTDSLDTDQARQLFQQLSFDFGQEARILSDESQQASLSDAAQNSSLVLLADKDLLAASTEVLAADQAAAQDPTSAFDVLGDSGLIQAEFGELSAQLHVVFADLVAQFADVFGLSDILQL
jgi:hypothetical protein